MQVEFTATAEEDLLETLASIKHQAPWETASMPWSILTIVAVLHASRNVARILRQRLIKGSPLTTPGQYARAMLAGTMANLMSASIVSMLLK